MTTRAIMIAKIATGEIEDVPRTPESEGKNAATVALGRVGGKARAAGLSAQKRKKSKKATASRWKRYKI